MLDAHTASSRSRTSGWKVRTRGGPTRACAEGFQVQIYGVYRGEAVSDRSVELHVPKNKWPGVN